MVRDVLHIYGVLSYFRRFILIFAAIIVLLARLMKGGEQELVWTWKHRKIVEAILAKVAEHSGLRLLNLKLLFILECEWGKCGIRGLLL